MIILCLTPNHDKTNKGLVSICVCVCERERDHLCEYARKIHTMVVSAMEPKELMKILQETFTGGPEREEMDRL